MRLSDFGGIVCANWACRHLLENHIYYLKRHMSNPPIEGCQIQGCPCGQFYKGET